MSMAIDAQSERLAFKRHMPPALRMFLGAAGLFAIVVPTWELRQALFSAELWAWFFRIIIFGAWAVGVGFLGAALLGESQAWRFQAGALTIDRQSLALHRREHIRAAQVKSVDIRTIQWDSSADTYSVCVTLKNGQRFDTPDQASREHAEQLAARIRTELHL